MKANSAVPSIGITSINGFPAPMDERFAMIRAAGFDSLLLWWGNDETECRAERVRLAHKHGLRIENVHAATDALNAIWLDGDAGEATIAELEQEVKDCAAYGIETIVLHLTNGSNPPPVTAVGLQRVERLIAAAEDHGVRLAFENVRRLEHVCHVLNCYRSPFVGLCYDSGHEHYWSPDVDWLQRFGDRVFAIHLHDNDGDRDAHLMPFDGRIDWNAKAKQIASSSYTGEIALETEIHSSDRYSSVGLEAFLREAYDRGKRLSQMILQGG